MVKCERCQKRIPAARLRALPETRICVGCSSEVGSDIAYAIEQERTSKPGSMKLNYGGITVRKYRRRIEPL